MKAKHVILRSFQPNTRDLFLGARDDHRAFPAAAAMANFTAMPPVSRIEVDEIDRKDIVNLTRQADIVAIAPAMPIKLIEARASSSNAVATGNISWGVKAVGADTSPWTGQGIVVAVLDTGIQPDHDAFKGVTLEQKNFTSEHPNDQNGHGTHCAGTIFGRDVDGVRIGVARGVNRALIGKVLGQSGGSSDLIANAIQWAVQQGAHVISMSLGIDFPGYVKYLEGVGMPTEMATSRALEGYRANVQLFERLASLLRAQAAFGQPVVLTAAAGNESQREVRPDFEIAVSPPAVSEGFISVAAIGQGSDGFVVTNFSNTGANVSAPGLNIISAKLGGRLTGMSGTSMATPHVAGVAALWAEKIQKSRSLSGSEWTSRLVGSATATGFKAGFDPFDVGAGIVQAPQS